MTTQEIFIQMALRAWELQISRTGRFFDSVSDDAMFREVAPGRNRIAYLLGHLIAVNDGMIGLFGAGERSYAALDEPFVKQPDKSAGSTADVATLRSDWKKSNAELMALFQRMTPDDWFSRHTAMTEEDFIKEPTRNKLSVLLSRTSHVAYHLGQLVLAK